MQQSIKRPLVIISSVINFTDSPLSYSAVRSVYSPEEREQQTLKTVLSVREKIPTAKIALIEAGISENYKFNLPGAVDQYIYVGNTFPVKQFARSKRKSLGEAAALYKGSGLLDIKGADYFFKLSGRYILNDSFELIRFGTKGFTVKVYGEEQISTRLYGFSADQFEFWRKTLKSSLKHLFFSKSIEQVMYSKIKDRISGRADVLGLSGFVAPDGNTINE